MSLEKMIEIVAKLQDENLELRKKLDQDRRVALARGYKEQLRDLQRMGVDGEKSFSVTLKCGEDEDEDLSRTSHYFVTRGELKAFMEGVSQGFGWGSHITVMDITDPHVLGEIDTHGGDIHLKEPDPYDGWPCEGWSDERRKGCKITFADCNGFDDCPRNKGGPEIQAAIDE